MTSPLNDKQQVSLNALLYDAVADHNLDRVNLCLSRGAETDASDMSSYFDAKDIRAAPLAHWAYTHYTRDIFETLARHGMPVDEADDGGDTVLARAVADQRADCVDHFLALGANPLSSNSSGVTILDAARNAGSYHISVNRERIIDALLNAMPQVAGAFEAGAKKSSPRDVTTSEDIKPLKPIVVVPQRKDGFQL